MLILGISEIDNDAGAVLLKNGHVVCAANEERFSRQKRHQGFPYLAIEWILKSNKITLEDIDYIAIAKADPAQTAHLFNNAKNILSKYTYFSKRDPSSFCSKLLNKLIFKYRNIPKGNQLALNMAKEISDWVKKNRCEEKVIRVEHHLAHAACAYWGSGFDSALVVTLDGQGEGKTSEIYLVEKGTFTLLHENLLPHSLGTFYSAITKALGYKPARHEGKITGLAAYGKPSEELLNKIREWVYISEEGKFEAPTIYGNYPNLLKLKKKYSKEDLSAAFQLILEEITTQYVMHYVKKTGMTNLALAGGVLANVKLNQRLYELDGVKELFVFPHMADGGLGYGAAQLVYREKSQNNLATPIETVYWGPDYSESEMKAELDKHELDYEKLDNIEDVVANLLSENNVVAHFNGAMEFGPRSLGNRSIIYPTTDPSVNDWLNKRLNRSEFMPFAPVTLRECAKELYMDVAGVENTAKFMTVTLDCTKKMQDLSPACVHIDNTARPQLIDEKTNPQYYKILKAYYDKTKIPSLVNTSFNMHEEPIVCSPYDAVRAFLLGGLDYLVMGKFLVKQKK